MDLILLLGIGGPWEIIIIVLVLVLLFGGRKIPELMKGLGQGLTEFKKATKGKSNEDDKKKKNEEIEEGEKQDKTKSQDDA